MNSAQLFPLPQWVALTCLTTKIQHTKPSKVVFWKIETFLQLFFFFKFVHTIHITTVHLNFLFLISSHTNGGFGLKMSFQGVFLVESETCNGISSYPNENMNDVLFITLVMSSVPWAPAGAF